MPVTQKDINALAKWMVSEPRRQYRNSSEYFAAFQNQVRLFWLDLFRDLFNKGVVSGEGAQGRLLHGINCPEHTGRPSMNECNKSTHKKRLG